MNSWEQSPEIDYDADPDERSCMDADDYYDMVRDDDSIFLIEGVAELINQLRKRMYYRGSDDRIAKDIIHRVLQETKMKIKGTSNLTDDYQLVDVEAVK